MTVSVSEKRRIAIQPVEADAASWYAIRTLTVGGIALFMILFVLAFTTAHWPAVGAAVPPYEQLVRNARLFHERFPAFAIVSPAAFALLAWTCVIGVWVVYLTLIWTLRGHPIDPRLVVGGAIVLGIIAVVVPPIFSTDPFSYAMYGRFAAVYHHNPYLSTATNTAPSDPLMPYLYWRDIPSPYGPLWTLVSQAIVGGGDTTPLVLVLRFKIVGFVAVMLDGWLIYRLVRQRWPARANWTYLAFAWNPLVLIEGIVIGHNDVLILALVLGSACLLLQARPVLSLAGLTASALIKYSTLPVIGLCAVRLLLRTPERQRFRLAARIGATVLVVAACAFFPYWAGYASVMSTANEPGRGLNNFILYAVDWALSTMTGGWLPVRKPVIAVGVAAALFGLWQVTMIWRTRPLLAAWTVHDELAAWCRSLTVFLMIWPRIHTWYFVVPLGLSLAAGRALPRAFFWLVLALTLYSYVSYFW